MTRPCERSAEDEDVADGAVLGALCGGLERRIRGSASEGGLHEKKPKLVVLIHIPVNRKDGSARAKGVIDRKQ